MEYSHINALQALQQMAENQMCVYIVELGVGEEEGIPKISNLSLTCNTQYIIRNTSAVKKASNAGREKENSRASTKIERIKI